MAVRNTSISEYEKAIAKLQKKIEERKTKICSLIEKGFFNNEVANKLDGFSNAELEEIGRRLAVDLDKILADRNTENTQRNIAAVSSM